MLTTLLLMIGSTLSVPAPAAAAKKAQDKLQGTWIAVAAEERGAPISADSVKEEDISLTIKGNEMILRRNTEKPDRFSFTVRPTKKPAQIDLKELGATARPGIIQAIYSVEKGELKICFANKIKPDEEKDRPQEFMTGPSEMRPPKGRLMLTFKKDRK